MKTSLKALQALAAVSLALAAGVAQAQAGGMPDMRPECPEKSADVFAQGTLKSG